jgi:hypothetical protein
VPTTRLRRANVDNDLQRWRHALAIVRD